jgi:small-conductance mechanosensitive channel
MNWEWLNLTIENLGTIDYVVIAANVLLIFFAQPLIRGISSETTNAQTMKMRFKLVRATNIFILFAYGYHTVYQNVEETGTGIKVVSIFAVFYFTYICNYFLQYLIRKHYGKTREIGDKKLYIETYQSRLFSLICIVVITLLSVIAVIRILGFESLLEAGGILGVLGVFLALTQAAWAPDVISGLIILNSDMFEEGDIVEIESIFGRVYRTKLFHTEIINLKNNHRIMLRNANMRDKTIHNLSKFATGMGLRECLEFNIGYDTSIDAVRNMFEQAYEKAALDDDNLETNPAPQVKILETGDHAIKWGFLFHVKKVDQLVNIRRSLREYILKESNEHNISLATPITQSVKLTKTGQ